MSRRRIISWDEQDVYTPWRKFVAWTGRPGKTKAVKRRTHHRERREAQAEIVAQRADWPNL